MKKFLLGLFGVAAVVISLLIVTIDRKFTVVHFSEVKQDGYGIVSPETFKVEMSPALAFKFAHKHKTFGFIMACVVLGLSVVWVIVAATESINFGNEGVSKFLYSNAGFIWLSLVAISIIIFFSSHGSILGNNYLNLDRTTYVHIRGNDQITPFASDVVDQMFLTKDNIIK